MERRWRRVLGSLGEWKIALHQGLPKHLPETLDYYSTIGEPYCCQNKASNYLNDRQEIRELEENPEHNNDNYGWDRNPPEEEEEKEDSEEEEDEM